MSEDRSTLLGGAPPLDSWSRRATQVRLLAGELGLPTDPAALAACDARDLVSIALLLNELLAERGSRRYRRGLHRLAAARLGAGPRPGRWPRALARMTAFLHRLRRSAAG